MKNLNDIYHIKDLILKYLRNELNANENLQFQEWISSSPEKKQFLQDYTDDELLLQSLIEWQQTETWKQNIQQKIEDHFSDEPRRKNVGRLRFALAASVFLIAGLLTFWALTKQRTQKSLPTVANVHIQQSDAKPGWLHAKLTLSDGSSIALDSALQGKLAEQGKTAVISSNGKLVYRQNGKTNVVLYNTLTTSKGEMYSTVLSDGSKIWLNSESSIRYPVAFTGDTREITTTGECYFEIAKDASKPFLVTVGDMKVQVLGTHFNISAYQDDKNIRTTLLEGSVTVTPKGSSKTAVLKPGQQAQLRANGQVAVVNDADLDKEIAWKNRMFIFNGDDVRTVMNRLARWYDLDVVYKGTVPDLQFYGIINMDQPASGVLKALQAKDARFQIEGKKIIVSP